MSYVPLLGWTYCHRHYLSRWGEGAGGQAARSHIQPATAQTPFKAAENSASCPCLLVTIVVAAIFSSVTSCATCAANAAVISTHVVIAQVRGLPSA